MFQIRRTEEFVHWLDGLKDHLSRARLIRRLDRARQGQLGGGDKSSQSADIAKAIRLAAEYDE